jgi:DNA-binding transcriptional ArsR family regulator
MKILTNAGLVEAEKIGQWMWYRRNEKKLRDALSTLRDEI